MSHHNTTSRPNSQRQTSDLRILTTEDSETLLSGFPVTRLSYEVSIHKNDTQYSAAMRDAKNYACFILPKGRRSIAWATEWKRKRIFVIIDIERATNIHGRSGSSGSSGVGHERPFIRKFYQENGWYPGKVRIFDACFDRTLVYGTVFGGIMFRKPNFETPLFSIHTVYWFQGNLIQPLSGFQHIALCEELFNHNNIRQVSYTKENSVIFGLPILCNTDHQAEYIIPTLPYETFAIQYRNLTTKHIFQVILHNAPRGQPKALPPVVIPVPINISDRKQPVRRLFVPHQDEMLTNIQGVFIVRPNLQNDIYELFVMPDFHRQHMPPIFHNFALIPNFKTSVFMNRLFRNISENERLDTMEESEDEADFENIEHDKYVTLSKEYIMTCRFHKRFCKWVPIEISTGKEIITKQQVKQHEMCYNGYHHRMK